MPNTLFGVLVFVAALGPGFVYVQIAERARPRQSRSAIGESVELVVIGAMATTFSSLLVFGLGDATGLLAVQDLANHGWKVLTEDTWRWLAAFTLVLALSYGAVWASARARYRQVSGHDPAGAGWNRAFSDQRPADHYAVATAHFRDGVKITGYVLGWTSHLADSRELLLGEALAIQGPNDAEPRRMPRAFVLIREDDLLYLAGQYVPRQDTGEPEGRTRSLLAFVGRRRRRTAEIHPSHPPRVLQ